MTDTNITPQEIAKSMQLRYVRSDTKGFSRIKKGDQFIYLDTAGKEIEDPDVIARIQGLVLPPAWADVWISPYANGHLQATGYDLRGRKQYRYHNKWSAQRNENKFDRIYAFGKKLPLLRKQILKDIRKKTLTREKVSAIALSIMSETYIRAGNTAYEKEYGSYGLTTLKNRHVNINGSKAFFKFKGKKGVVHQIAIKDASLARLLRNVRELPGQELFQYYDENGELRRLDSGDINNYLKENMHEDFTCKDFRTWAGSVAALQLMSTIEDFDSDAACKRNVVNIVDGVATKLGNTRTICKKYYIHPALLQCYEQKKLQQVLVRLKKYQDPKLLNAASEKALLFFLKSLQKQAG
jgi:DNA topoisomerase I